MPYGILAQPNQNLGVPQVFLDNTGLPSYIMIGGVKLPIMRNPIEVLDQSAIQVACASTAVDEVLETFTIQKGVLGVNSVLQFEPVWAYTNSANSKILKVKINGATIYTATRTTTVREAPLIVLANRNSLSSQVQPYDNNYAVASAVAVATQTIDFSNNAVVQITGQRANAGDSLTLEYFRCIHFARN